MRVMGCDGLRWILGIELFEVSLGVTTRGTLEREVKNNRERSNKQEVSNRIWKQIQQGNSGASKHIGGATTFCDEHVTATPNWS